MPYQAKKEITKIIEPLLILQIRRGSMISSMIYFLKTIVFENNIMGKFSYFIIL